LSILLSNYIILFNLTDYHALLGIEENLAGFSSMTEAPSVLCLGQKEIFEFTLPAGGGTINMLVLLISLCDFLLGAPKLNKAEDC